MAGFSSNYAAGNRSEQAARERESALNTLKKAQAQGRDVVNLVSKFDKLLRSVDDSSIAVLNELAPQLLKEIATVGKFNNYSGALRYGFRAQVFDGNNKSSPKGSFVLKNGDISGVVVPNVTSSAIKRISDRLRAGRRRTKSKKKIARIARIQKPYNHGFKNTSSYKSDRHGGRREVIGQELTGNTPEFRYLKKYESSNGRYYSNIQNAKLRLKQVKRGEKVCIVYNEVPYSGIVNYKYPLFGAASRSVVYNEKKRATMLLKTFLGNEIKAIIGK